MKIHPFQDGNGRLSRALTTLLLLKSGYEFVPYASFEKVIEDNKDNYYLSLRRGQTDIDNKNNSVTEWVTFFLKCMQSQKKNLESKLETDDKNKVIRS